MRIVVAGIDKSSEIGGELTRRAARHQGALSPWSATDSALSLKASRDIADYLEHYSKLMRLRYALSTESFTIPGKPGTVGSLMKKLKAFLWKMLRYQHDRMAHQQNAINELVISAQDFQNSAFEQRIKALEQRISELEKDEQAATPHLNPLPQGERKDGIQRSLPLPPGERAGVRVLSTNSATLP